MLMLMISGMDLRKLKLRPSTNFKIATTWCLTHPSSESNVATMSPPVFTWLPVLAAQIAGNHMPCAVRIYLSRNDISNVHILLLFHVSNVDTYSAHFICTLRPPIWEHL